MASSSERLRPGPKPNPERLWRTWRDTRICWRGMVARCHNPLHPAYKDYGARGVRVCEQWRADFWTFARDMGVKPPRLSIDRVDNDGNYEPGNCRWATNKQQQRNMRSNRWVTAFGERRVVSDWAQRTGLGSSTIIARLDKGWSGEHAVSIPPNPALSAAGKKNRKNP